MVNPALLSNLHTHTIYSDGTSTFEEYIEAAISKGFKSIGFSDHGPTPYYAYSLKEEAVAKYLSEIARLKEKFSDKIEIYAGIEYDFDMPWTTDKLDYVIGSAHYVKTSAGQYIPVDNKHEDIERLCEVFNGIRPVVQAYYDMINEIAAVQRPDIIGHVDLISKLNKDNRYFNPNDKWYQDIIDIVIDNIAKGGGIVEINTGAMSRGYKDCPYPAEFMLRKMYKRSIPVTISSDCHNVKNLDYAFDNALNLVKSCGYTSVKQLLQGEFRDVQI